MVLLHIIENTDLDKCINLISIDNKLPELKCTDEQLPDNGNINRGKL